MCLSENGSVLAISAMLNDWNGHNAGHAQVFKYINNAKFQRGNNVDGEADSDWFGELLSFSNSGNVLAIRGWLNNGNGPDAGHVRVYEYVNSAYSQRGNDIDGNKEGDEFGVTVSLSGNGNVLAVGGWGNDGNCPEAGHVCVFECNTSTFNAEMILMVRLLMIGLDSLSLYQTMVV